MSAVMTAEPEIEPHGYGHELLTYWADCTRGGLPGSHCEWASRERTDRASGPDIPEKAMRIERIVSDLCHYHPNYRSMIKHYYLGEEAYFEVAGKLKYTVGFVKLSIQASCDYVARRYEETMETG